MECSGYTGRNLEVPGSSWGGSGVGGDDTQQWGVLLSALQHSAPQIGRKRSPCPREGAHDSKALRGSSDTEGNPHPCQSAAPPPARRPGSGAITGLDLRRKKPSHREEPPPGKFPRTDHKEQEPSPGCPSTLTRWALSSALPGTEAPASPEGVGAWEPLSQEPTGPHSTPSKASSQP